MLKNIKISKYIKTKFKYFFSFVLIFTVSYGLTACSVTDWDETEDTQVVNEYFEYVGSRSISGVLYVGNDSLKSWQVASYENFDVSTDGCVIESTNFPDRIDLSSGTENFTGVQYLVMLRDDGCLVKKISISYDEVVSASGDVNSSQRLKKYASLENREIFDTDALDYSIQITGERIADFHQPISTKIELVRNGKLLNDVEVESILVETDDPNILLVSPDGENAYQSEVYAEGIASLQIQVKGMHPGSSVIRVKSRVKIDDSAMRIIRQDENIFEITGEWSEGYRVLADQNNFVIATNKTIENEITFVSNDNDSIAEFDELQLSNKTPELIDVIFDNEKCTNTCNAYMGHGSVSWQVNTKKTGSGLLHYALIKTVNGENVTFEGDVNYSITDPVNTVTNLKIGSGVYNEPFYELEHIVSSSKNVALDANRTVFGILPNLLARGAHGHLYAENGSLFFRDTSTSFGNYNVSDTKLVLLPSNETDDGQYLGDWNIVEIADSHTLKLDKKDVPLDLDINQHNLSYVIGSETRYNTCDSQAEFISLKSSSVDGSGQYRANVSYGNFMNGKTVVAYFHANQSSRIGAARIYILQAEDVVSSISKTCQDYYCTDTIVIKSVGSGLPLQNAQIENRMDLDSLARASLVSPYTTNCKGEVKITMGSNSYFDVETNTTKYEAGNTYWTGTVIME
jgi:hypothetical protein